LNTNLNRLIQVGLATGAIKTDPAYRDILSKQ
jgi:hypothetical protein